MSRVATLVWIVLAAGVGFVVGWQSDRLRATFDDSRPIARPDALDAAWRAYDADDLDMLRRALVIATPGSMPTPDHAAEADVLGAIATGDLERVSAAADRHAGRSAGAVALVRVIERAQGEARASAVSRLRERHPESWFLVEVHPESPDR